MQKLITTIARDIREVLFPVTCLVCGDRLQDDTHLCTYCQDYAFEPTDAEGNESIKGVILPEWIRMQDSLWEFDKGGFLQDILHQLKYGGLAGLGITLGRKLGYKLLCNPWLPAGESTVLIPVPLHPGRKRKRGYNQSLMIAKGVAEVTGSRIIDENAIIRIKNTRTQTGLNAKIRRDNIEGAFVLQEEEWLLNAQVIIIDDVITTGATTMEIASIIRKHAGAIGIAAIARA